MNSKNRRHKAWVTARWAKPGKYKEALAEGTDPVYFYDEWESVKDGLHYDPDRTHIRSRFMSAVGEKQNLQEDNKRLIRLLQRRKAKKEKEKLRNQTPK
jgi:hypothetical protein